jgi:DNA-binding GntR family transcriptional regulator
VYQKVKNEIFDFHLLPGERFSEADVAQRMGVSRTPVREALFRLAREGYLQVHSRTGWTVKPFDFREFEDLYDLRILLEEAVMRRLCEMDPAPDLTDLQDVWLVPETDRIGDGRVVAQLDEAFHQGLMAASGNSQIVRVHRDVTERIRIIRRLDFTKSERITVTYEEHAKILRLIMQRRTDMVPMLMRSHINASKAEVRRITLHMLHTAREQLAEQAQGDAGN